MRITSIFTATIAALSIQGTAQQKNAPSQIIKGNEELSHNGVGFQPGDKSISFKKGQALQFSANKLPSLETITESCDASSENEKPSHNGVRFKSGDEHIWFKEGQALQFYMNKPPELS